MAGITKRARINKKIGEGVTKKTPLVLAKLEQAFALDCSIAEACLFAKIDESTYYRWVNDDPELSERFTALRNSPVLAARQSVINNLEADPELAFKYLTHKRPDEFSTKSRVESAVTLQAAGPPSSEKAKQMENAAKNYKSELKKVIAAAHGKKI